jgi:stage III sporulation protein AD
MSDLFKLGGGAIIAAVCAMTVKKSASGMGGTASVIGLAVILGSALARLSSALTGYMGLTSRYNGAYVSLMLKSLGVGITVRAVTDVCRELGEESIASGVELAGKAELLLLCLPTVAEITKKLTELLG